MDDWEKARASVEQHLASPSSGTGSFRATSPGHSHRPPTPRSQRQWQVACGVRSLRDSDVLKKQPTVRADGPYEERHKDNWFVTQALRSSPLDGTAARSGPGGSSRSPDASPSRGSPCRSPGHHSRSFSNSRLGKGKTCSTASTATASVSGTGTPVSCLGSSRCSDAMQSTRAKLGFTNSFCLTPSASQSYDPLHLPTSAAASAPVMGSSAPHASVGNCSRGGAEASRCRSRDPPARPQPQQRPRSRDAFALSAIARRSRSVERPEAVERPERQGPIMKERTPRDTPGWDISGHPPRASSYDPPAHAYSSRYSADAIFSEQLRGWQALPLPPAKTAGQPGMMTFGAGRPTSPQKAWAPRWPHQYAASSPQPRSPDAPWRPVPPLPPQQSPPRLAEGTRSAKREQEALLARVAELTQELASVCGAVAAGSNAATYASDIGGQSSAEWGSVARQLAHLGREFPANIPR